MKTIEDRLTDAHHALALIIAALASKNDHLPISEGRIDEAIFDAAVRAHNELHWLRELPAAIQNLDAPDDDERDELDERRAACAEQEAR